MTTITIFSSKVRVCFAKISSQKQFYLKFQVLRGMLLLSCRVALFPAFVSHYISYHMAYDGMGENKRRLVVCISLAL